MLIYIFVILSIRLIILKVVVLSQWHGGLYKKKVTGGVKKQYRKKRNFEMGSLPAKTRIGERHMIIKRARGNKKKFKLLTEKYANVTDPSSGETNKSEILRNLENPVSLDYERRGIITKSAIIETSSGRAKVTSRPGQDGVINAILITKD